MTRPYTSGDLEAVLRLWEEAGGWYRTTMPVTSAMARGAFEKLTARPGFFRAPIVHTAWIDPDEGPSSAFLYARREPDIGYVVPLLRGEAGAERSMEELIRAAQGWFAALGARTFRVDLPSDRPELAEPFLDRGRGLWHRDVFRWRSAPMLPTPGRSIVPFRARHKAAIDHLARARFPTGMPPAAPIPFLEAPHASWMPLPTAPVGTRMWVVEAGESVAGVAGATRFVEGDCAELAPFILAPGLPAATASELVGAVLAWLKPLGVGVIRASLPRGLEAEAEALRTTGFERIAEGDVVEVRVPTRR